ncbi:MAG: DNA-3-methyladenine glycosylase [Actinobacteria bacterium]|nr:DNA-3-methyladenine glycosylase [Actinomycetota bacterium]
MNPDYDRLKILNTGFYSRDTSVVARELLGKILVRQYGNMVLSGIIVETEAYYGSDDPASHAFRGKTPRSEIMFGRPGIAYVYFCYGMYYLLNAVTENIEVPGAVLIRAVQPAEGIDLMLERRNAGPGKRRVTAVSQLANGPGKITIAFGINISDNGKDLTCPESDLKIYDSSLKQSDFEISSSSRIGVSSGKERFLRYRLEYQKIPHGV